MANSWYAIRKIAPEKYRIVKFTNKDEFVKYYDVHRSEFTKKWTCNCLSSKAYCKHFEMVDKFRKVGAVDSGGRYVYDTGEWLQPLLFVEM